MCPGPDGRTFMNVVCPEDVSEMPNVDIYLSLGKYQIMFLYFTFLKVCPGPAGRTFMNVVCPIDVSEMPDVDIYLSLGRYEILFCS